MMWRIAMWWRGWRYHRGWRPAIIDESPEQDFYGSMTLAGEMKARGWLSAPEVAHEHSGWWGQTAADLSPEMLDAWGPRGPSASYEEWLAEGTEDRAGTQGWPIGDAPDHRDPGWPVNGASGPEAGSSLAPGPDYDDGELGTGPFVDAWQQRKREEQDRMDAMIVWPSVPDPELVELGPNAARVLARWEERRRERWRLDWDNETMAA